MSWCCRPKITYMLRQAVQLLLDRINADNGNAETQSTEGTKKAMLVCNVLQH